MLKLTDETNYNDKKDNLEIDSTLSKSMENIYYNYDK